MTFEQVVLLLSLIGGGIVSTAELTWKIFESSYKKKKSDRPDYQSCGHFSDESDRELTTLQPAPFLILV